METEKGREIQGELLMIQTPIWLCCFIILIFISLKKSYLFPSNSGLNTAGVIVSQELDLPKKCNVPSLGWCFGEFVLMCVSVQKSYHFWEPTVHMASFCLFVINSVIDSAK